MIEEQSLQVQREGPDGAAVVEKVKDKKKDKKKKDKDGKKRDRAVERVFDGRQDADKMMVKWIRASLSLVTIGVGIERVVWHLQYSGTRHIDPYSVLRFVGLTLALLGIAALAVACSQHRQILSRLDLGAAPPLFRIQLSLVVGIAVAVLCVVALASVLMAFN